jgi:hypothetical protein
MSAFVSFPSIGKLSDAIEQVPFVAPRARALTFRGTVKLHGTNACLVQRRSDGAIHVQSRNRVLTLESDNCGCARFFEALLLDRLPALFAAARKLFGGEADADGVHDIIAGEFCGRGIQSKVALCSLPRMFVVFALRIGGPEGRWVHAHDAGFADVADEAHGIYSVARCPCYTLEVDLSDPAPALEEAGAMTAAIDEECPFARTFGVVGPGEGIVWTCEEIRSPRLWFKTKGVTHMTPLAAPPPDPKRAEEQVRLEEVARCALTEQRMEQGLAYLREMGHPQDVRSTSAFCRWVADDAMREEARAIKGSGLATRDVRRVLSALACNWFKIGALCETPPRIHL